MAAAADADAAAADASTEVEEAGGDRCGLYEERS